MESSDNIDFDAKNIFVKFSIEWIAIAKMVLIEALMDEIKLEVRKKIELVNRDELKGKAFWKTQTDRILTKRSKQTFLQLNLTSKVYWEETSKILSL